MRRVSLATAERVLGQLKHDPRTVALLLMLPLVLLALVKWVFAGQPDVFQRIGAPLLGIFPLTSMFLVTSIAMLRERVSGTLERLMTMPLGRFDLLLGYGLAFGTAAAVQATVTSLVAFGLLGLEVHGAIWSVLALAVLNALLGTALGLFVSAFATSEFQAVQFMPVFLMPQLLLCGLFAPREHMARALVFISDFLPMTYAYDALHRVTLGGALGLHMLLDLGVLGGAMVAALVFGAATLPRRTP
jgi:ABC-2 type transport system permease protein